MYQELTTSIPIIIGRNILFKNCKTMHTVLIIIIRYFGVTPLSSGWSPPSAQHTLISNTGALSLIFDPLYTKQTPTIDGIYFISRRKIYKSSDAHVFVKQIKYHIQTVLTSTNQGIIFMYILNWLKELKKKTQKL